MSDESCGRCLVLEGTVWFTPDVRMEVKGDSRDAPIREDNGGAVCAG